MEIRLIKENPIQMEVTPNETRIIIYCREGQNAAIEQFLSQIKPNPQHDVYNVEITQKRAKRSKQANAYMWVLCEQIAIAINSTREEVYRDAIRKVGAFTDVAVQAGEPLSNLLKTWSRNGLGWFSDTFDSGLYDAHGGRMKGVRLYKGSSRYDTAQMSRLIDYVVEEAKGLGIQTETPEEIERIKQTWGDEFA